MKAVERTEKRAGERPQKMELSKTKKKRKEEMIGVRMVKGKEKGGGDFRPSLLPSQSHSPLAEPLVSLSLFE